VEREAKSFYHQSESLTDRVYHDQKHMGRNEKNIEGAQIYKLEIPDQYKKASFSTKFEEAKKKT
jgi:hypothetical protein